MSKCQRPNQRVCEPINLIIRLIVYSWLFYEQVNLAK